MENRAVLVTGASRGIGRAIALALANDGFDIGVHYFSNSEGATEVEEAIEKLGRKAVVLNANIANENEVKEMVKAFTDQFHNVFGLVNNAGVYNRVEFEKLTLTQWDDTIATNLTSAFMVTHELLPYIMNGGRIINIASILAHSGSNYGAHYATSKAGLLGFTKSIARELNARKILVNAVAPGAVDTQILAGDSPEKRKQRESEIPLGRIGQPDEIGAVVAFLFSEKATYITGETFNVNGGLLMP
jgi:3-oxoacyl-[acyl-carrier protein] reductase